jgi:hypothetical protein
MRATLTDLMPGETAADTRDYPMASNRFTTCQRAPKTLGGSPSILLAGSITGLSGYAKTEMEFGGNQ